MNEMRKKRKKKMSIPAVLILVVHVPSLLGDLHFRVANQLPSETAIGYVIEKVGIRSVDRFIALDQPCFDYSTTLATLRTRCSGRQYAPRARRAR